LASLGLIEGYYGKPWSWEARAATISFLKARGYDFFLYAPKADLHLREKWREDHPVATADALKALGAHCRGIGVRFGVGLSPFELYRDFNAAAQADLARKLAAFDDWGVDDLAILFDDMRGDLPNLAATQADILHWVSARTKASRVIVCPSYYTDDNVLDRIFGVRPANYLEDLGRTLDKAIDIFWTGPEVCSREFAPSHLPRVADQLGRKPLLWDNYPVNDGARMSQFLHIRAFTGRPASIAPHITGHAINPALQPILTRIPAVTLAEGYRLGDDYDYARAFISAARDVLGADLAPLVQRDVFNLNDTGLDLLPPKVSAALRKRYAEIDHDAAREIIAWLDGAYRFSLEIA